MAEHVHTRWATLSWPNPNTIELRFTSGILLDMTAIAEVIGARKRMQGDTPVGLLLIVPAETELDMAIIGTDHLRVHQATDNVLGFAVAEVFTDEEEARAWLDHQVARTLELQTG